MQITRAKTHFSEMVKSQDYRFVEKLPLNEHMQLIEALFATERRWYKILDGISRMAAELGDKVTAAEVLMGPKGISGSVGHLAVFLFCSCYYYKIQSTHQ